MPPQARSGLRRVSPAVVFALVALGAVGFLVLRKAPLPVDMVLVESGLRDGDVDPDADKRREHCANVGDTEGDCAAEVLELPKLSRNLSMSEPFWLDAREVSQADYRACVQEGSCAPPDLSSCLHLGPSGRFGALEVPTEFLADAQPVTCVTLADARAYCAFKGRRLPTEEEWELAALSLLPLQRGAEGANGADPSLDAKMGWDEPVILREDEIDGFAWAAPVDTRNDAPGAPGTEHMLGNVWEWVDTIYPDLFLTRGGSWSSAGPFLSRRFRRPREADARRTDLGFRCAADVP